jgi:hypothetical protein
MPQEPRGQTRNPLIKNPNPIPNVVSEDHHNNFDKIWKKEIQGRGRKKSEREREEQKWWEECFIHFLDAKKDHGLTTYIVGTRPA